MWARQNVQKSLGIAVVCCLLLLVLLPSRALAAITPLPIPSVSPGSFGLEATKKQPPPTRGATITVPGSGASYSNSPITVSGICPNDLLVQIYNNAVLVGAVNCKGGSFSLQVSLFSGQNDLTAIVYDSLNQAGPVSNTVTVSYNNATFSAFGALVTLTSNYGRLSVAPKTTLNWPLILTGGSDPYAFSINWGDGTPAELKSQANAGSVTISHVYDKAGIYPVTIKVTDVNGVTAFLQLMAIATGDIVSGTPGSTNSKNTAATGSKVLWMPTIAAIVLLFPTYWLGRRSELVTLRKQILKAQEESK